jgi:hypothetical protein
MSGKVCFRCKGKILLGIVNKLLKGEDDGIESRLTFKLFSTLTERYHKSRILTQKEVQNLGADFHELLTDYNKSCFFLSN